MALNRRPSTVLKIQIGNKAGAYSAGNQVGVAVEIPNAVEESGSSATLLSLAIQDPAKQDKALDILFFSQQPSAGTDGAAVSISATDLANLLGIVNVPTTAYADIGTPSVGTVANINLKLKATKTIAAQSNKSVWMIVVTRGTPTYGAANSVYIQLGLDRD